MAAGHKAFPKFQVVVVVGGGGGGVVVHAVHAASADCVRLPHFLEQLSDAAGHTALDKAYLDQQTTVALQVSLHRTTMRSKFHNRTALPFDQC